jgi:hypothetical protein
MTPIFAELALPDSFWVGMAGSAAFGLVGLVLLLMGMVGLWKVFDRLFPKLHFGEELEKGNMAVAVVVTGTMMALLGSIAYIVGAVVH